MKRAIVIGASSGIGRQVAQLLIQDGWYVGIAARRESLMQGLRDMAPERVVTACIDVTKDDCGEKLTALINAIGGMYLFFYAAGIGWQNRGLEPDKEIKTMETNAMGFTRMIGTAFRYLAGTTGGHIAAITSIAGTKGLGPAPAYSASKAMQNKYLEALEQLSRTRELNIFFTDIRPGFVDTPLLAPKDNEERTTYPMLMQPGKVAKHIIMAINNRKHVVVIDARWRILTALWQMIPRFIWTRMKI